MKVGNHRRHGYRLLALACATTFGFTDASAQSTTGSISGQAQPGTIITATSDTGVTRKATVGDSGRYTINTLPVGSYTVTLQRDDTTVDSRDKVQVVVNSNTEVSFASEVNAKSLQAISVNASAIPRIDVSTVDSRTVITAKELERLPIGRTAEAIATLAPGVVAGSSYFAGPTGNALVSFGGSSVSENAYYINGFNSTDPLNGLGGIGLPYGAIDQQETFTGGYSAKYGRSTGGVINQIGKRGTNEWHFGAQVQWTPGSLASDPRNMYYPNRPLPEGYGYADGTLPGTLFRSRRDNTSTIATYDAYLGGPLIKDKLFLFAAVEAQKQNGQSTSSIASSQPAITNYTYQLPKRYVKLDWNINDSNILEFTNASSKNSYNSNLYAYDYATAQRGALFGHDLSTKTGSDIYSGKFTSYITDDLTFSATYDVNRAIDYSEVSGANTSLPFLSGVTLQDPAITGGSPIRNGITTSSVKSPNAHYSSRGLRMDLEYKLGSHLLSAGIDNINSSAHDEGQQVFGPGYAWVYGKVADPSKPINPDYGVGAPGGSGYYVYRYIYTTTTSMSVEQKAQYIEDHWQINDHWLLNIGLRNDQFTNYNFAHQSFVHNTNQWAPRLGFSWDVLGGSTFKVFGNLGRYYLALPNSVAERAASGSTYTTEYFTYSGIDPSSGAPTGLKPLGPGPVSANNEYGQAPNPKTVAAKNLRSQYQDEAILGFNKTLGNDWLYGAKITVRKLQTAIDDVCDTDRLVQTAIAQGVDPDTVDIPEGCLIFNPGRTNTFLLPNSNGNGFSEVTMTNSDWGFTNNAKRKYYALDLFLEHPFDGKWQGRIDYTFSRSYGNTEGQVLSTIGQDDVSKTQDWDFWQLMEYSNGVLSNDRTHQFKAYGSYQITPEWLISGSLQVTSGAPKVCLGYYGSDDSDPVLYRSSYHYCAGKPTPLGSLGRLPWTKQLNLGATYRPAFADNKLALNLDIFNVLNDRKPTVLDATYETAPYTVSNTYGMPLYLQTPRYVRLSASYDW
ncbi:TonB-dependent receptor [Dyella mobilis]|uniref:TonB-dependent receptor n=1 Tax=Dyella mobilis TaxID=1849582 RepID=A0ABS2KDG3_9GAMM|nr:TonB-dependent receptor [Dyella mobilis]MBM7129197.1 TonB-dependent receptor [Dyella mobilis]GLQ98491.1 Oar protein [Dyella mobilis]